MAFKEYNGLDPVRISSEVLQRWKDIDAFGKSLKLREGHPEFIFFEGPPSANGMPGIHHVMARSIKDAVCRYKTQAGYKGAAVPAGIPTDCLWSSEWSSSWASPQRT